MTIDELIENAEKNPLTDSSFTEVANNLSLDVSDIYDLYSRKVAEGYLSGKYSWQFGDAVMNRLHSYGMKKAYEGFSKFYWGVFEAFDEGEYIHKGDEAIDGEPRTKKILSGVLGRSGA